MKGSTNPWQQWTVVNRKNTKLQSLYWKEGILGVINTVIYKAYITLWSWQPLRKVLEDNSGGCLRKHGFRMWKVSRKSLAVAERKTEDRSAWRSDGFMNRPRLLTRYRDIDKKKNREIWIIRMNDLHQSIIVIRHQ